MEPTATTAGDITLEAHVCDARRSYLVTFTGPDAEALAVQFISERGSTHQFHPAEEGQEVSVTLLRAMYPYDFETCDHGLSARLCADPINHYPADL